MDALVAFAVGCFALLALMAGPIALVLAMRSERRLRNLERRIARLMRAEPRHPTPPVEPTPARSAAPPPVIELEPEPVSAPAPEPQRAASPTPPPSPFSHRRAPLADLGSRLRGVDWERWIGVRGAAVFGGALLALAAILFFRHAFTQGWIKPVWRVWMGAAAGIACLAGGDRLRRRGFAVAPSALQGAGIVALYAAIYAADKRYHFLSIPASFPLMALVTALACTLAVRHGSRIIAVLGLVGGFATPLLLSTGSDRPLPLFGYILLLDLGLFFVGRKRGWASIGFLALLGTLLIESLWVFGPMGQERVALGIGIVALFAACFALVGARMPAEQRRRWLPAQAGGVLFPFVFALYFADQVELGEHVWPNALLLGLLALAGCVLSRGQDVAWLAHGAATAGVAVVGVWFFQGPVDAAVAWELSAVAFGLAAIPHAFAEWERRRDGEPSARATSAGLAAAAWMALLVIGCLRSDDVALQAPACGLVGVALLLVRQGWLTGRGWPVLGAGIGTGLGIALHHRGVAVPPFVKLAIPSLLAALLALGLLGLGRRARPGPSRFALHAAAALLVPVLVALPPRGGGLLVPLLGGLLAVEIAVAATLLSSAAWLAVGAGLGVFVDLIWAESFLSSPRSANSLLAGLGLVFASATLLASWPAIVPARLRSRRLVFPAPAAALAVWAIPVATLYEERFGDAVRMTPFLLLAAIGAAQLGRLRRAVRGDAGGDADEGLTWIGGATALLVAAGLATQIGREEPVLAAAFWSVGLAALARWIPREGPAWLAVALAIVVAATTGAHALESGHYLRSEAWLFNPITTVHLVPAACLLGTALLLSPVRPTGARGMRALFRGAPGLALVATVFVWINVAILNFFGREPRLSFDVERLPQRDLTTSLAWGVYALALLGLGTWRGIMALRWTSLGLFFLAIGKVFLRDLGHLEGLYRVGSLAGLAVSLLVVSLFYQRFVFRGRARVST